MRRRRWLLLLIGPLVFAFSGCLGQGDDSGGAATAARGDIKAVGGLTGYAEQLAASGRIRIGVKYDAPGIGYLKPGASAPEGFDVEIGKILAGGLGIAPDHIQWVQTLSSTREETLSSNSVDLVVSSYSMTRGRMQQVGMAGPYYITGAQLLVRSADQASFAALVPGPNGNPRLRSLPDTLERKVCTTTGSTTAGVLQDEFKRTPVLKASFADCVSLLQQGTVAAVATDGVIGMGYAHESGGALTVVGDPFTEEKYGVGFQKGMAGMCDFVQRALLRAYKDGSWQDAFTRTLGKSGVKTPPEPPAFEPC